jgi:hypothetical protein
MTPQQLSALKAYILADPVLAAYPMNSDGHYAIAEALNQPAAPAFIVWKTRVTWDEIMENGMDFTRVDNLTNGSKWRIWEWLFKNSNNAMNPSKVNHRAGIDASWVGTAQDLAVRAAVYVHCKRPATVFEKVLATGTGSDAMPATMGVEGPVSYSDVGFARNA